MNDVARAETYLRLIGDLVIVLLEARRIDSGLAYLTELLSLERAWQDMSEAVVPQSLRDRMHAYLSELSELSGEAGRELAQYLTDPVVHRRHREVVALLSRRIGCSQTAEEEKQCQRTA